MKSVVLTFLWSSLVVFIGCYSVEDAADVNQDRIKVNYHTVFKADREITEATIHFRFGQTPLRLSQPMYFKEKRLQEQEDIIFGLHYSRTLDDYSKGLYIWMDENGKEYKNEVKPYGFSLNEPIKQLQKYTYYKFPWTGQEIPYEAGTFRIAIESLEEYAIVSFDSGEHIEIHADKLDILPVGRARMTIARKYSEPVEDPTKAGGCSTVSFEREFQVSIID